MAAVLLAFALSGCAALPFTDEGRAQNLLDGLSQFYRTEASVRTGEMDLRVRIDRPDPLNLTVELLYPERLAGFTYTLGEGMVGLSYRGLAFHLDPFGATRTSPLPRAAGALSALLIPDAHRPLPTLQNGVWQLADEFDGESVLLYLNEESGVPTKLLLVRSGVELVFENFAFLP
ncbi:MAG: hypothetical protein FWE32_06075 [Oscillospiraceae bacterium]|nr:hypothetical protein [Oscillospiraceae bacterium]